MDVTGVQGDKVKLTYFKTGTFMLQGCPVLLHSQIVEFLAEYLELDSIVNAQLKLINTNITAEEALNDLEAYLPNSYISLKPKIKAVLSPSLVLRKLALELTDYSSFAFPALRGLEAYLKSLFASKEIIIGRKGFGPYLSKNSHGTLNQNARNQINCEKTCTAINMCYGYYRSQRHGLFHANGIIETTRVITVKEEALSIVTEVIDKIERSYLILNEK